MTPPSEASFVPLSTYRRFPETEMLARAEEFAEEMARRRTVREFSDEPVPREVVERCIRAAATAPNGANLQPWHFILVGNREVKRRIRSAAEEEEREFYSGRAPDDWLDALVPLGTDAHKPFLERAPWLIAVFAERYGEAEDGSRRKNYYVTESVGLATGILITALHLAGLATLTHTPSPMNFLNRILERPERERPFLLLVAGYPEEGARIPRAALEKKPFREVCTTLP
jgi:iodotyrosine deiodinase